MGRDRILTDTTLLVKTAFKIIDEEGFEHFSARKLAGVLGISHMTVYNYMQREEILDEVVITGFSIMNENILPHVATFKSGLSTSCGLFSFIADELLTFAKVHRNIYRFMFQTRIGAARENPRLRALYMSGMEWVRDAIPEESFAAMQDDVFLFLLLVNGLILGYLNHRDDAAEAKCRKDMARAYEHILSHYCTDV